jgi:murein tripeptide amidase MpaA
VNSADEDVETVRAAFDWYIYPVVNVDGYEYTYTDVSTLALA